MNVHIALTICAKSLQNIGVCGELVDISKRPKRNSYFIRNSCHGSNRDVKMPFRGQVDAVFIIRKNSHARRRCSFELNVGSWCWICEGKFDDNIRRSVPGKWCAELKTIGSRNKVEVAKKYLRKTCGFWWSSIQRCCGRFFNSDS